MKYEGVTRVEAEPDMWLEKEIDTTRTISANELVLEIRKAISQLLNKQIENVPTQEVKHALFLAYWWLKYNKKGFEDQELYKAYYKSLKQEAMLVSTIEHLLARKESFYFLYSTYIITEVRGRDFTGTAIDYRYVKVDIVFKEESIRIVATLLKDYEGSNVGRILD